MNKSGSTNQLKLLTLIHPRTKKKSESIYEEEKVRPEEEGKQTSTIIFLSEENGEDKLTWRGGEGCVGETVGTGLDSKQTLVGKIEGVGRRKRGRKREYNLFTFLSVEMIITVDTALLTLL